MKFKKLLLTVVSLVSVLGFSQSAFAIANFADTKLSAVALGINPGTYQGYITTSTDEDWFYWTNNTGVTKTVTIVLASTGSVNNDLMASLSPYGSSYNVLDSGGVYDSFTFSYVAPGETVYYGVKGHNGSYGLDPYYISTTVN